MQHGMVPWKGPTSYGLSYRLHAACVNAASLGYNFLLLPLPVCMHVCKSLVRVSVLQDRFNNYIFFRPIAACIHTYMFIYHLRVTMSILRGFASLDTYIHTYIHTYHHTHTHTHTSIT